MTTPASLVASLREDQRARWRQGDAIPVEAYLEQYPLLATDPEAVVDLIWNEWNLRQEQGNAPALAELQIRFGQYEASIQERFQASRTGIVSFAGCERPEIQGRDLTPPSVDLPQVPDYEILAELGRGGMGVVYLARQISLNRQVALKMILNGTLADAKARARFHIEAQAVARLQHPNIVRIHAVGEHEGRVFFTLEYLEGGNLQQARGGMPQPEAEAARLVETLARAVHHIHENGILHRDLKPTNILLAPDGTPKITDFGLAKLQDAEGGPTRTEALIGTPSYMSPEQAAGNTRQIGVPADVYALGIILYELLTGRVPFYGTTVLQTLEQVRTQEPAPPRRFRGRVARDLETICLRCLEKEPGKRYLSAAALADDLHRFLEGQPIAARPVPAWQRLGRWARRRPALVASFLGMVALVGALLAGWSYFGVAEQLAGHQAEEKYQKFLHRRNEALFYGLLTSDQGEVLLGGEAAAHLQTAAAAAREALALAGLAVASAAAPGDPLPAGPHQDEMTADCYALFLVLASLQAQQAGDGQPARERYREALRTLERARGLGLQTQAYHRRRAYFLEQLGELGQARLEKDRALALAPQGALDHFLSGEERYRRGDWEGAMNAFDRALALQPGHFWAQFFLAVCHLQGQHWEAAKAGLNACLTQQPDFVWGYLFRSFANERLQALPEARADFDKALALNPNEHARYVLVLTRGILHYHQQELPQAAADFQAAMALRPEQYNAYLNLAQVYLAQKQFELATQEMHKAVQLHPPVQVLVGYHVERGRNLLRDNKYEDALQACAAALELAPDQAQPYEVRGRALLALGHFEQAEESLDVYLLKGGEAKADVFRNRGLARMKRGRYPEAADDYTRALERAPDAALYQHRGWAHFFADAWKLALRDFARAVELDPDASDAHTGCGLAHVMLGQYRQAVADAEAALRRTPGSPEMMHNIACIFAQAMARAAADSNATDRDNLTADYRSRALAAIRRTLAMLRPEERGAFWQSKILPDAALAPIRADPMFQRLQREYGSL